MSRGPFRGLSYRVESVNKQAPAAVGTGGGKAFAAVVVGAVMIVGGGKALPDMLLGDDGNRRAVQIHSRRQSGACIRRFGNHGSLQTTALTLETLLGCSLAMVDGQSWGVVLDAHSEVDPPAVIGDAYQEPRCSIVLVLDEMVLPQYSQGQGEMHECGDALLGLLLWCVGSASVYDDGWKRQRPGDMSHRGWEPASTEGSFCTEIGRILVVGTQMNWGTLRRRRKRWVM